MGECIWILKQLLRHDIIPPTSSIFTCGKGVILHSFRHRLKRVHGSSLQGGSKLVTNKMRGVCCHPPPHMVPTVGGTHPKFMDFCQFHAWYPQNPPRSPILSKRARAPPQHPKPQYLHALRAPHNSMKEEVSALPMRVPAWLTNDVVNRIAHRIMRWSALAPASAAHKVGPQRIQRVATWTRRIRR